MKSKRSKACDIPPQVKLKVFERDNGLCIICGEPGIPNAHLVRRSQRWPWYRTKCSYSL